MILDFTEVWSMIWVQEFDEGTWVETWLSHSACEVRMWIITYITCWIFLSSPPPWSKYTYCRHNWRLFVSAYNIAHWDYSLTLCSTSGDNRSERSVVLACFNPLHLQSLWRWYRVLQWNTKLRTVLNSDQKSFGNLRKCLNFYC